MNTRGIIIDGGSLENLFTAGGSEAWDQLLSAGRQLIVPEPVLREMDGIPKEINDSPNPNFGLRQTFEAWAADKSQVSVISPLCVRCYRLNPLIAQKNSKFSLLRALAIKFFILLGDLGLSGHMRVIKVRRVMK